MRRHDLAFHLDGARLFNAAVALGVDARALARPFDTVSICLSKGLGAPVGSVLCGPSDFIERARRWRKVLGGGWRQAGVLAAAGIIALRDHPASLADDHQNARHLVSGLEQLGYDVDGPHTNMVFVSLDASAQRTIGEFMSERGIELFVRGPIVRLVTHRAISRANIARVVDAFAEFANA